MLCPRAVLTSAYVQYAFGRNDPASAPPTEISPAVVANQIGIEFPNGAWFPGSKPFFPGERLKKAEISRLVGLDQNVKELNERFDT